MAVNPADVDRLVAQAVEQGQTERVTDPDMLRAVAAIVNARTAPRAA